MDNFEIISDRKKIIFKVLKKTTKPCPQCGVPACGKEDILWYEKNNQRIALIFDGGYFNLAVEEYFEKYRKVIDYDSLPNFMKDWFESCGWVDSSCYEKGHELDIKDFLNSLRLLDSCEMDKWISEEDILSMREIAKQAQLLGAPLKIVRG